MRVLDTETIKIINTFESMAQVRVRDCILNDNIYFLVEEGDMGKAIGRAGANIKVAEKMFKKRIFVYEWNPDIKTFAKNNIPGINSINIVGKRLHIKIAKSAAGGAFGARGARMNVIRMFFKRNFGIEEVKVVY